MLTSAPSVHSPWRRPLSTGIALTPIAIDGRFADLLEGIHEQQNA
jgi:hypothetical protein